MNRLPPFVLGLVLCALPGAMRADVIATPKEPPQQMVLTGTLSQETITRRDGSTVKGPLFLLTKDNLKINLPRTPDGKLSVGQAKEGLDVEKLLGKPVKIVAEAALVTKKDTKITIVRSVSSITEDPEAKPPAPPADGKPQQGAGRP